MKCAKNLKLEKWINGASFKISKFLFYVKQVDTFLYLKTMQHSCVKLMLLMYSMAMTSQGSHMVRESSLRSTYVALNFKLALYSSILVILFLYNHSSPLFLNTWCIGATPTFNIESLRIVNNVKMPSSEFPSLLALAISIIALMLWHSHHSDSGLSFTWHQPLLDLILSTVLFL